MNKVAARLLVFTIGFPSVVFLMLFDWGFHLAGNLAIVVVSALGAMETGGMMSQKGFPINHYMRPVLGLSLPLLAYLEVIKLTDATFTLTMVALLVGLVFVRQIYTNQEVEIQKIAHKVSGNLLVLIYPGLFLYYMVKMSQLEYSSIALVVFIVLTFGNDAAAYVFGSLFGKNSKKPFVVSPNKSTVGFIGGLVLSVIAALGAQILFPQVFGPLWLAGLMGLLWGGLTVLGDLFESSLKRSLGTKDSGGIIPGRGGILDSIDSLLFTAPVYYFYLYYIQNLSL